MRSFIFFGAVPTGRMLRYFFTVTFFCDFFRNMRRQVATAPEICYSVLNKNAQAFFARGENGNEQHIEYYKFCACKRAARGGRFLSAQHIPTRG